MNFGPALHARTPSRWLVVAAGVVALLPLLVCWHSFEGLYWFGDEWDLLDRMHEAGLVSWAASFVPDGIGENFIPLFKLIWGGAVIAFHGSYLAMLILLWLTHAATAAGLALLLRRTQFGWPGILFAAAFAALPASSIEALGWTIQFSQVFSFACFVWALVAVTHLADRPSHAGRWSIALTVCVLAGLSTFSRGVLSALTVCAALWWLPPREERKAGRRSLALLVFALALAQAAMIGSTASGNHQQVLHSHFQVLELATPFAANFWLLNPLHALLRLHHIALAQDFVLGACKVGCLVLAVALSQGRKRAVVLLLAGFDLCNAGLVALGRYQTGLEAAVASRYQYVALFCFAPALGALVDAAIERLPRRLRLASALGAAGVCGALVAYPWPRDARGWMSWRGQVTRKFVDSPRSSGGVPFDPRVSVETARALRQAYGLH